MHQRVHSSGSCDAVARFTKLTGNDKDDHDEDVVVVRKYNDPELPPMEFLLAVMHDDKVPMAARIDAAKAVSVYMHPRLAQVTQEISGGVKIIIEGGLPALPGTNIIMPDGTATPSKSVNGSGGHEE